MNRLTRGLSKSQLRFSLVIFALLGTGICSYTALSGFLSDSRESIHIDALKILKSPYNESIELKFLDVPVKKYAKQSSLSIYIDSVMKAVEVIDLSGNYDFKDRDIKNSPKTRDTNSPNYKKYNYGK
ncbi:hypothetical protein [uncultured Flavobacterium sp.]|uniref:hypothetical protein n=1 Tax=uncultured Flavobacterium sp. TaxID=165435 RepID=UPI0025F6FEDA|nr:hypothetical protein [uncultured Flavobacterium sp.]